MIHQFSAHISGNIYAATNTPFNFALQSAYKISNKEIPFFGFNFEELQMSILDCPDTACIELFTAKQCLILHWLTFLTETAKHKLGQPKQQYEMQLAKNFS